MADDARDVLADVIQRASAEYRRLSRAIQVGDLPPAALPDVGQLAEERFIADAIIAHWSAAGFDIVPREQWERAQAIAARTDDSHRRTVDEAIRRASNADGSARTADWIQR